MRSDAIIQRDDGTPTGSRSPSFFIRGILGPDAWSIFMRWLTGVAERFSVAASLVGHPGDGWRFRPGCSIGRPARPGVLAPLPMLTLRGSILQVLTIIRPGALVGWHRAGFRCYWRWKSRPQGGRPLIATELRGLIRQMSMENPLWGAPRIQGELLKLGFEVAQSSVAKYMVKRRGPPSQGWRTFL